MLQDGWYICDDQKIIQQMIFHLIILRLQMLQKASRQYWSVSFGKSNYGESAMGSMNQISVALAWLGHFQKNGYNSGWSALNA